MVSLRGESVTTVMSVPRPLFFLPASSCAEWRSRKYAQDMEYTLDKNGRLFRVIFLSACKEKRWDFSVRCTATEWRESFRANTSRFPVGKNKIMRACFPTSKWAHLVAQNR